MIGFRYFDAKKIFVNAMKVLCSILVSVRDRKSPAESFPSSTKISNFPPEQLF